MIIRNCQVEDLARITAIYAWNVENGTGTFETTAPSLEDMRGRYQDVLSKQLPYLLAEKEGEILGFCYANWFKPRPAYRYSAEDSIYLAPEARRQGVGKGLLSALINQCEAGGLRKLIAVIGDSDNAASIALHQACGFSRVGVISSCGWKFGRWLDIVLMEKVLGDGSQAAPE